MTEPPRQARRSAAEVGFVVAFALLWGPGFYLTFLADDDVVVGVPLLVLAAIAAILGIRLARRRTRLARSSGAERRG